jgi:2'-5' RNA ligase
MATRPCPSLGLGVNVKSNVPRRANAPHCGLTQTASTRRFHTEHHEVQRPFTMAKQLPTHLSQKCALVLLPPSGIAAPIEAVRRVHDKQFQRWPAHINLLFPFLLSPSEPSEQGGADATLKQDIRMRIERVTRNIQPFRMSLDAEAPGVFHHTLKSSTLWLRPTGQSVQELHAVLQAEFCDVRADRRLFKPHLSMGQARNQDDRDKLSGAIKESVSDFLSNSEKEDVPLALDWLVDRVHVIERNDYKARFNIIGTIDLGKE